MRNSAWPSSEMLNVKPIDPSVDVGSLSQNTNSVRPRLFLLPKLSSADPMTTRRNRESRQYQSCRALIRFPRCDGFGHQKKKKKIKRIRQYEKLLQLQERHDGKCNLIDTNYAWRFGESTPPIISLSEISYILSHISRCLFILLSLALSLQIPDITFVLELFEG